MNSAEKRFLYNVSSLTRVTIPKLHRVICGLIVFLVITAAAVLYFTPWMQTAYGTGAVDTLDPKNRTQAISALIDGQIKQWHVREGMQVKAGDPIVTLVDIDAQRLDKLESQLAAAKLENEANETAVANAQNNLARQSALQAQGLVSRKEVEQAQIKLQELKAKAAASVSYINEVSMSLSRQATLTKVAPVDGTIVRLFSGGVSTYVKAGQVLGQFIPANVEKSVRITITGLDAPLVKPGAKARLQFEGWPVFQFSGWPGSAIGTFGGEVVYVEPFANETGAFQVWIKPDESDVPWPKESSARLGSRVKAWVLLEEVKLGYELWRQLNNFPPQQTSQQGTQQTSKKVSTSW
ncbi:HlyD family efflux transporter periplasmic adaptor subunit [Alteromonas sp. 345S023]|uniref:HlyD family efflux transporter periplasmic adaptor subunit n=1 Tax=Alteromonas profundi TaxID=2696062 RepID=A0A7X5LN35_9ALTE|nr:biotin/lipoyl-binding protein [Alteromonas profundi]NDV91675.1 HlyD family efflux transporter periplasmic adaptor subunit [Alteromonas profundi]